MYGDFDFDKNVVAIGTKNYKGCRLFYLSRQGIGFAAVLKQACDYLESVGGGTIRLTNPGNYYLEQINTNNSFLLPNNIKLVGFGSNKTNIIKDERDNLIYLTNLPMFKNKSGFNGAKNIRVEGISFTGWLPPGWVTQTTGAACFSFYAKGETNCNFINCSFYKTNSSGIGFEPVFSSLSPNGICWDYWNIWFEGVYTDGATCGSGIHLGTAGGLILVKNCKIQAKDSAIAIFQPTQPFEVFDNYIDGFYSNQGQAIEFTCNWPIISSSGKIYRNKITNYRGGGIFSNDLGNNLNGYNQNFEIYENQIWNIREYTNGGGNAIFSSGGRGHKIYDNKIWGCDRAGIRFNPGSSRQSLNNQILQNEVFNNGKASPLTYCGIEVTIESEGKFIQNIIENNNLYDNQKNPTQLAGVSLGVKGGYPASSYFYGNRTSNRTRLHPNQGVLLTSDVRPNSELTTNNTILN